MLRFGVTASALAALLVPHVVLAQDVSDPSPNDRVLAPLAYVKFCKREPEECEIVARSSIGAEKFNDVETVNREVNDRIRPRRKFANGQVETWMLEPTSGDCNDYAVTKRHELLQRGWSSRNLLLSEVETGSGEAHLVLMARTRAGDVVLDNLTDDVKPVDMTSYKWVKRQSSQDPNVWVRLGSWDTAPLRPEPLSVADSRQAVQPSDSGTDASLDQRAPSEITEAVPPVVEESDVVSVDAADQDEPGVMYREQTDAKY